MRNPKAVLVSILAVLGALSIGAAGNAFATEFYSGSTTLGAGTELVLTLSGSTTFQSTGGEVLNTCTGSELRGKTSNAGGPSDTVRGAFTKLVFVGTCINPITVVETGELEFHYINSQNALITTKGFRVKWVFTPFGGECTYTGGTGVLMGTLTGSTSEAAEADVETVLSKVEGSFLCPSDVKWNAKYIFTSPKPLHVTAS